MAKTGKIGMVGQAPKVIIKPSTDKSLLTPEQKAQARFERRRLASEKAEKTE